METIDNTIPVEETPDVLPPPEILGAPPESQPKTQMPPVKPKTPLEKFNSFTMQVKIIIIGGALLFFLLALLISFSPRGPEQLVLVPSPLPSDTPEASASERQTSEFAKTEDFKKFEQNIKSLKDDNTNVDLSESQLSFPLLDMEVNFEPN